MKAATKTVEIQGIRIAIPTGSMDKPTVESEQIMKEHQDPRGWKYPIRPFTTTNQSEAEDYSYCLNWYVGGHEMQIIESPTGTQWTISSRGYYHYIGA